MALDTPFGGYLPSSVNERLTALEVVASTPGGAATITRVSESDGWFASAEPFVAVALNPARDDASYLIDWEVTDADDLGRIGDVIIYDKATNGFKVKFTGSTDNVVILWKLTEIAL